MSAPPPQSNYDIIVLILLAFLLGLPLDYLTFRSQKRDLFGSYICIKLMLLACASVTFKVKFQETQIDRSSIHSI